ncbi:Rap1a/Tai family immunity protein [Sediminicoccus sp. KRV36]|uniref:Rap1a/Tai family immunity protein n=1 Tax=Sediminicoccus sp. KRV36 TaxID=3133721 RepID=UPI0020105749|nr:Rap1a/Tai family immunity protein [Sediminicoccus rosea]UPY38305.1 hypothetical protein LHU95_06295 [Sediminicoccus rosea]
MLQRFKVTLLVAGLGAASLPAAAQVTPDNFVGGRVSDLAALCAAGPGDPNVVSAVNFCHGFLMATGQFHAALTRPGGKIAPMFCPASPLPTIAAITAGFVDWARANPQYGGDPAVEGVVRFATAVSPCPTPANRRARAAARPQ